MIRPAGTSPISNEILLRFFVSLTVAVVLVQCFIAFVADNEITIGGRLLLAVVAVAYFSFRHIHMKELRLRPYSDYLLHVGTYLIVNGSFWIHAAILVIIGRGLQIDEGWYGQLFGMSIAWGIGLFFHTFGTLMTRGNENVHI